MSRLQFKKMLMQSAFLFSPELIGERKILVFGGGVIPDDDVKALEALGVAKIFTSGASTNEIAEWVKAAVGHR